MILNTTTSVAIATVFVIAVIAICIFCPSVPIKIQQFFWNFSKRVKIYFAERIKNLFRLMRKNLFR